MEGMQRQGGSSQETVVQRRGRVPVPPQGIYITKYLWVLLQELRPPGPRPGGGGNFRLSIRFLEHRPVISPPTNQKKATPPAALTPNFAYKNSSPKTIKQFRVFEHEPHILLAWPCNKPFSAPNSDLLVWPLCGWGTQQCLAHSKDYILLLLLSHQAISLWIVSILNKKYFFLDMSSIWCKFTTLYYDS